MDADDNHKEQLELAASVLQTLRAAGGLCSGLGPADIDDVKRLAELVLALDAAMQRGQIPPLPFRRDTAMIGARSAARRRPRGRHA